MHFGSTIHRNQRLHANTPIIGSAKRGDASSLMLCPTSNVKPADSGLDEITVCPYCNNFMHTLFSRPMRLLQPHSRCNSKQRDEATPRGILILGLQEPPTNKISLRGYRITDGMAEQVPWSERSGREGSRCKQSWQTRKKLRGKLLLYRHLLGACTKGGQQKRCQAT